MKLKAKTLTPCLATAGMFVIVGTDAFAETKLTSKGHGVTFVNEGNQSMADGSVTQLVTAKYVEIADDGDFAGQTWSAACYGMGSVTAAGDYSGVFHCTANLTADDAFTFVITDNPQGGETVITSGKGKYKGATGNGTVTYTWGDVVGANINESFVTWVDEFTVVLP